MLQTYSDRIRQQQYVGGQLQLARERGVLTIITMNTNEEERGHVVKMG